MNTTEINKALNKFFAECETEKDESFFLTWMSFAMNRLFFNADNINREVEIRVSDGTGIVLLSACSAVPEDKKKS